jgi:hypothetical protein
MLSQQLQQLAKPSHVVGDTTTLAWSSTMATSCWSSDQSLPQVLVNVPPWRTIESDRAKDPHGTLMAALTARHLTSRLQIQQLAGAAVYVKAFTTGFIAAVTPPAAQPAPCRSNPQNLGSDTLALP